MPTLTYNNSKKPEFTAQQLEQLKNLRDYIKKLRELAANLKQEFPETKTVSSKIESQIQWATDKITDLEIEKVKSQLERELK